MARDRQADKLIEVRDPHRGLRRTQKHTVEGITDLYAAAYRFAITLAADETARTLLPRDELQTMVDDARNAEAISRKLLDSLGYPLPTIGHYYSARLGDISLKFDEAMTILEKDLRDESEA
jgi:hypothetical protein